MKTIRSSAAFSLAVSFLLLCSVSASPFSARLVNGVLQGQVSAPEGLGSYSVGFMDFDILAPGNETLSIAIYYPSMTAGEGSDPNMTDSPYPGILFSPGFFSAIDVYRSFAETVASWGFVFTLVGSDPLALDFERAADVSNALNWLDAQNDNSSFELAKTVNESKFGIAGHSLGSEVCVTVARSDPRLKVLVSIAPFTSSPGAAAYVTVPILILVGSGDTITPPNDMAYPLYQNGNNPKLCITTVNDNHLSIVSNCSEYVVSFLKFYLCESWNYATFLYGDKAWQKAENGLILLAYDLRVTVEYQVTFKGIPYDVTVYSDSFFQDFSYDEALNKIDFILAGPPSTFGTASISIPRQIAENCSFEVYFDNKPYPHNLTSDITSYSIHLSYRHSVHSLTIDIADIVPESLATSLTTLLLITTITLAVLARSLSKNRPRREAFSSNLR